MTSRHEVIQEEPAEGNPVRDWILPRDSSELAAKCAHKLDKPALTQPLALFLRQLAELDSVSRVLLAIWATDDRHVPSLRVHVLGDWYASDAQVPSRRLPPPIARPKPRTFGSVQEHVNRLQAAFAVDLQQASIQLGSSVSVVPAKRDAIPRVVEQKRQELFEELEGEQVLRPPILFRECAVK